MKFTKRKTNNKAFVFMYIKAENGLFALIHCALPYKIFSITINDVRTTHLDQMGNDFYCRRQGILAIFELCRYIFSMPLIACQAQT